MPKAKAEKGGVEGLEIEHDLSFERREWKIERLLWLLMVIAVLAGLAGLVGPGPLSRVRRSPEAATHVEYDRFLRIHVDTEIAIETLPPPGADSLDIELVAEHLQAFQTLDVVPEPETETLKGETIVHTFAVRQSDRPIRIVYRIEPIHAGARRGWVRIGERAPVPIRQFVYP